MWLVIDFSGYIMQRFSHKEDAEMYLDYIENIEPSYKPTIMYAD